MPPEVKRIAVGLGNFLMAISLAVSLTWGVSLTLNNYRLANITARLGTQEVRLLSFLEAQAELWKTQAEKDGQQDLLLQRLGTMMEIYTIPND